MARTVLVVVAVTNSDGQCVGSADHRVPTIPHDDRHVVILLLFTVERFLGSHNS